MLVEFWSKCLPKSIVFIVLLIASVTCQQDARYSNQWVMKLNGDVEQARQIASEHNFKLLRQVGKTNYYVVEPDHHRARRALDDASDKSSVHEVIKDSEKKIASHAQVESFEREKVLIRKKRDYVDKMTHELQSSPFYLRRMIEMDHQRMFRRQQQELAHTPINKNEDPYWSDMWYLNRHLNSDLPDMNVTAAWAFGYSGRGVSVTFLDDGLEWDHPDIQQNFDARASTDINGNDSDPTPRYEETNENKHGTRCAGEVAAVANNSVCSVGVAFNSGIGGIRMLDGDVTDSVEASSLSFNSDHIAIYSASWGPDDNGEVVDGPGPLARKAFADGVAVGRNGLGSIFVWASGNGGRFNDSCACDGYANSIYTLSISSTSENSEKPWYLEECTSTLATTYSSGDERRGEHEIITTDIRHKCTIKHTGTSAAAPLAAGIIALALEANPKMTWRDIMYITVLSSRPKAIKSNNFIINKRGLLVSSRYGFGLMNAGRMVEMAKTWVNVPQLQSCTTANSNFKIKVHQFPNSVEAILSTDACQNTVNEVNYIEQVEIIATIRAPVRGLLEIYLTSPMGTKSLILPRRSRDSSPDGFKRWSFMSVQLWGEFPKGDWTLSVSSSDGSAVSVDEFMLVIHGTKTKPVDYERYIESKNIVNCNFECSTIGDEPHCSGPTASDCRQCLHYSLNMANTKTKCVSYCPFGYYADNLTKNCIKCHYSCLECSGPTSSNCSKCLEPLILNLETNECVDNCLLDDGYFINSDKNCQPCSPNCQTCSNEAFNCLSCNTIDYDQILVNNVCMPKLDKMCDSGMYYDKEKNDCYTCDIECAECTSHTFDSCIKCPTRRKYLEDGTCVSACTNGYYTNQTSNRCIKCNSNCQECESKPGRCLSCKPGYKLNDQSDCVRAIFNDDDCSDKNCFECYGKEEKLCLYCKNGFALLNGECFEQAPIGYFRQARTDFRGIYFTLEACVNNCDHCNDKNDCIKCKTGFSFLNGQCFLNCDSKYFATAYGTCKQCEYPCENCMSEDTCKTCAPNKYFLNGKCLDSCPPKYYSQDLNCLPCYPSCETCTGPDQTNCLTCNKGFKYSNSKCISKCPDATYFDEKINECVVCDSSKCSLCIKDASTCIKCFSPLALDEATFTCKSCCSRSIHGKLKYTTASCCNCPSKLTGYCLKSNQTAEYDENGTIELNQKYFQIFIFLFVILAFILFLVSVRAYKSKKSSVQKFKTVEYSSLSLNDTS